MKILTPDMMHVIESANLGEKSCKSFVIILTIIDSFSPIITPFDHGSRFEAVGSNFVHIFAGPIYDFWPKTECQQKLKMPSPNVGTLFLNQLSIILRIKI